MVRKEGTRGYKKAFYISLTTPTLKEDGIVRVAQEDNRKIKRTEPKQKRTTSALEKVGTRQEVRGVGGER